MNIDLIASLRISRWWNSLIPFLFGTIYILVCLIGQRPFHALFLFLPLVCSIFFTVAFGYFLNDLSDRKSDRLAGKKNISSQMPLSATIFLVTILFLFAVIPWLFLPLSHLNLGLYVLEMVLLTIYSVPPFKLKNRGLAGVITDALYNATVPLCIIVATALLINGEPVHISYIPALLLLLWSFLKGMRGIIVHQVADRKFDRKAQLRTFVLLFGPMRSVYFVNRFILPLESLFFLGIIGFLSVHMKWLWISVIVFAIYLFFYLRAWDNMKNRKGQYTFSFLNILNDFYEEWLPVIAGIYLCLIDPLFIILVVVHVLLFYRIWVKMAGNIKIVRISIRDFRFFIQDKLQMN